MGLRRLIALLLGIMLVAVACDDGDGGTSGTSSTTSSTTTTTEAFDEAAELCDFAGDTGPKREELKGIPLVVTDVEVDVELEGCVETVSFSLRTRESGEDSTPGYDVRVSEPPFVATNDDRIEVEGEAFVTITLLNAMTLDENFEPAYTGPDEIRPEGTEFIVEVVKVSDFEGVSEWVVGLAAEHPFAVSEADVEDGVVVAFGPAA